VCSSDLAARADSSNPSISPGKARANRHPASACANGVFAVAAAVPGLVVSDTSIAPATFFPQLMRRAAAKEKCDSKLTL
jgi:hypothetical protein